jgi:hypothetical protein
MASPTVRRPDPSLQKSAPFILGSFSAQFVHVLDEVTLPILLQELDTISDFVSFLNWKAELVKSECLSVSSGEEHLLALFIRSEHFGDTNADQARAQGASVVVGEDLWDGLVSSAAYRSYKARLRPSYFWDQMVQLLADDVLNERMLEGNEAGPAGHERRIRALARPSRAMRLQLSQAYGDLFATTSGTHFRAVVHPNLPDSAFLFLVLKREGRTESEYRATRGSLLRAYSMVYASDHPGVRHVVGVSSGPSGDSRSQEVFYIDRRDWTPEDDELANDLRQVLQSLRSNDDS